jgi:hypothetical protein
MPQPLIQPVMPLMSIPAQPARPPQQPAGQPSQIMRSGFGKHISTRVLYILDFILTHVLNLYRLNGHGSKIPRSKCSFSSNTSNHSTIFWKYSQTKQYNNNITFSNEIDICFVSHIFSTGGSNSTTTSTTKSNFER